MTDKTKLREETKKQIRALLLSAPHGRTVRELARDFTDILGSVFPFRELGYPTPEDFLKDIPDIVRPSWEKGVLILRGVSNDTTKHIEKMVSRQKTKAPARRLIGRISAKETRMPPSAPTRFAQRGRRRNNAPARSDVHQFKSLNMNQSSGKSIPEQEELSESLRPKPQPPPPGPAVVTPFLRGQIRELLYSYPSGILASGFNAAFSHRFGEQLNHKRLGFPTLGDLIHSIPDIVELEELSGGLFRLHGKRGRGASARRGLENPEEPTVRKRRTSSDGSHKSRHSSGGLSSTCGFIDDGEISSEIKHKVRMVLSKYSDGIWAARFPIVYKEEIREELPMKDLGYLSVIDLMAALPDIVTIERPSPHDWKLYDARIRVQSEIKKEQKMVDPVPEEALTSTAPVIEEWLQETVRQVLQANPQGVPLENFSEVYERLTGKKLPLRELGFQTPDQFLLHLPSVVRMDYRRNDRGSGHILLTVIDNGELPMTDRLAGRRESKQDKKNKVPSDAVGPGIHFMPVAIPRNLQYMEVFVSNVVNPGNFWLQIRGQSTTEALETLMDQLEEVYHGYEEASYTMPESFVTIGQVAAAIFVEDDNWHRVQITGIKDLDFVEAYYVDYGNTCSVHKNQLRFLKSSMLRLPAQAIRARLANIKPKDGKDWSHAARMRMLKLCSDRALMALVVNIDKDNVMSVCLCDTSTEEDLHINDMLISEGHAEMDISCEEMYGSGLGGIQQQHITPPESRYMPSESDVGREGFRGSEIERQVSAGAMSFSGSDEMKLPRQNILFVELTERHSLHIINYNDRPFVTAGEISALLWEKDLLRSKLRHSNMKVEKVVLAQEDYPELFEDFVQYKVQGTTDDMVAKPAVSIYPLESVPAILQNFGDPSEDLLSGVREQMEKFNPHDPHWKGESYYEEDNGSSYGSESVELSLEDLKVTLQALQFKRKRILHDMMQANDSCLSSSSVEELNLVEEQMKGVREKIKQLENCPEDVGEASEKGSRKSRKSPSQVTIEDYPDDEEESCSNTKPSDVKTNRVTPLQISSSPDSGEMPEVVVPSVGVQDSQTSLPNMMNALSLTGQQLTPQQQQQILYQSLLLQQAMLLQNPLLAQQNPLLAGLQNPLLQPFMGMNPQAMDPTVLAAGLGMGQSLGSLQGNTSLLGQGRGRTRNLNMQFPGGNPPRPGGVQ